MPRFNFQAVLTHCQPFFSGSVRKRATNSNPNAEKWSILMQFAVVGITWLLDVPAYCRLVCALALRILAHIVADNHVA